MNKDEWVTLLTTLISKGGAVTLGAGVVSSNDAATIAGAIFTLGAFAVTAYTSWNMRKVPETSVVTSLASSVPAAKSASIAQAK